MENVSELFKAALYNEVKNLTFYHRAAELTQNDESRMLFLELIDMEEAHSDELLIKAAGAPCTEAFDAKAYLEQLQDNMAETLAPSEDEILRSGNIRDVLKLAISLEIRARDTYITLAAGAKDPQVKHYCEEMAQEENRHMQHLTRVLNSLDMDPEDRPGL